MRRCASVVLALVLLCSAALTSCSSGFKRHGQVPEDARFSAVIVYPFGFRWPEAPYRPFELSGRLIRTVLDESERRVLVFGPSEFRVYRPDDDNVFAATTVGALMPRYKLRPDQLVVLRPWAEKRVVTSAKTTMNSKGEAVGAERQEEVTYVGRVELVRASTREQLFEVTGERVSDPFAERTDEGADPTPELTALMTELTKVAMEALEEHLTPIGEPALFEGLALDVTPHHAFSYSEGRPSFEADLVRMDPLDRELFVHSRVRFSNPELSPELIDGLVKLPGGLFVRSAPQAQPLRAGDVVVEINGEPALLQTFYRARLLPGPDALKVRRHSGDYEDVTLP